MNDIQEFISRTPDSLFSGIDRPPEIITFYDTPENQGIDAVLSGITADRSAPTHAVLQKNSHPYFIKDGEVDMADGKGQYHKLCQKKIGRTIFFTQFDGSGIWNYGKGRNARLGNTVRNGEYVLVCVDGRTKDRPGAIEKLGGRTATLLKTQLIGNHNNDLWGVDESDPRTLQFIDPLTGKIVFDRWDESKSDHFYSVVIGVSQSQ